jgi:Zn-dependent M28 family amino/carboxypeptidase
MRWLETDGTPHGVYPALRAVAMVSDSAAAVFREAGSVTATIRVSSDYADLESPNVAALLRGSDPRLRDEVVVVTAHLDHLGIGAPVDGDSIYNGVWDNASGIAAMLEVARAAAARPERPRRSLLFLAVTAEERGLLGSDYFAEHPTVPIERIVADVNLDGLSIFYPLREIVAHGAAHSTLEAAALRAAARLGIEIAPDPIPQEVIFIRSDQYSFVRRGVPSVFPFMGMRSDSGVDAAARFKNWLATRYHLPQDDVGQPMDLEAGARQAQLEFLVGLEIANADERPAWKAGDFFGRTFGTSSRDEAP